MKIFIPQPNPENIGGPTTFLRNLNTYAKLHQIEVSSEVKNSDLFFFPIATDIPSLLQAKTSGIKMVQRLDGLHHFERNGVSYLKKNLKISLIYKFFSDYKIFQSEYSKRQCFHLFSPIDPSRYTVINNGCDQSVFYPDPDHQMGTKIKFVTTGSFRHLDMIKPVVDALDKLKGIDFELHVLGPIVPALKEAFAKPYCVFHGSLKAPETARMLRDCDIFLFSVLNAACPNALIEAVTSGLPVVAYNSGAVGELCEFSPEILAETPDKIHHGIGDFDSNVFAAKLMKCIKDFPKYKKIAMENHSRYDLNKMGFAYFDFFKKIL